MAASARTHHHATSLPGDVNDGRIIIGLSPPCNLRGQHSKAVKGTSFMPSGCHSRLSPLCNLRGQHGRAVKGTSFVTSRLLPGGGQNPGLRITVLMAQVTAHL